MKYKFLEHTGEAMFEAYGKNLEELFVNAGLAMLDLMVGKSKVEPKIKREFKLESDKVDLLLYDFLSEIIFYKDAERLVFSKLKVKISEGYKLEAEFYGVELDMEKHEFGADPKAVTLHRFEVKEVKEGWKATVIIDI